LLPHDQFIKHLSDETEKSPLKHNKNLETLSLWIRPVKNKTNSTHGGLLTDRDEIETRETKVGGGSIAEQ
jgi:hypothetical protein